MKGWIIWLLMIGVVVSVCGNVEEQRYSLFTMKIIEFTNILNGTSYNSNCSNFSYLLFNNYTVKIQPRGFVTTAADKSWDFEGADDAGFTHVNGSACWAPRAEYLGIHGSYAYTSALASPTCVETVDGPVFELGSEIQYYLGGNCYPYNCMEVIDNTTGERLFNMSANNPAGCSGFTLNTAANSSFANHMGKMVKIRLIDNNTAGSVCFDWVRNNATVRMVNMSQNGTELTLLNHSIENNLTQAGRFGEYVNRSGAVFETISIEGSNYSLMLDWYSMERHAFKSGQNVIVNPISGNIYRSILVYGSTVITPRFTYFYTPGIVMRNFYDNSTMAYYVRANEPVYFLDDDGSWYFLLPQIPLNMSEVQSYSVLFVGTSPVMAQSEPTPVFIICNHTDNEFRVYAQYPVSVFHSIKGVNASGEYYMFSNYSAWINITVNYSNFTLAKYMVGTALNYTKCQTYNNSFIFFSGSVEGITGTMENYLLQAVFVILTIVSMVVPFTFIGLIYFNDVFGIVSLSQMGIIGIFAIISSVYGNYLSVKTFKSLSVSAVLIICLVYYLSFSTDVPSPFAEKVNGDILPIKTSVDDTFKALSSSDFAGFLLAVPTSVINLGVFIFMIPVAFSHVIGAMLELASAGPFITMYSAFVEPIIILIFYAYAGLRIYEVLAKDYVEGGV